jgi:hypothetical protein
MNQNLRRSSFTLLPLLATSCLLAGCGDIKGAIQAVGAKVVEESSDETIRGMFEAANDACPTRMDAFTTLEEVEMIDDQRVEFHYLVNDAGKKIASRLDKRAMKKAAVDHMRGNVMANAIADRDLSIEHIYEDSAGNHILSYTINRAVLAGEMEPNGSEQSNPFEVTPVKASAAQNVVAKVKAESKNEAKAELEREAENAVKEPPVEEKPALPQHFNPPHRTKDNPAGVQSNPYVNKT